MSNHLITSVLPTILPSFSYLPHSRPPVPPSLFRALPRRKYELEDFYRAIPGEKAGLKSVYKWMKSWFEVEGVKEFVGKDEGCGEFVVGCLLPGELLHNASITRSSMHQYFLDANILSNKSVYYTQVSIIDAFFDAVWTAKLRFNERKEKQMWRIAERVVRKEEEEEKKKTANAEQVDAVAKTGESGKNGLDNGARAVNEGIDAIKPMHEGTPSTQTNTNNPPTKKSPLTSLQLIKVRALIAGMKATESAKLQYLKDKRAKEYEQEELDELSRIERIARLAVRRAEDARRRVAPVVVVVVVVEVVDDDDDEDEAEPEVGDEDDLDLDFESAWGDDDEGGEDKELDGLETLFNEDAEGLQYLSDDDDDDDQEFENEEGELGKGVQLVRDENGDLYWVAKPEGWDDQLGRVVERGERDGGDDEVEGRGEGEGGGAVGVLPIVGGRKDEGKDTSKKADKNDKGEKGKNVGHFPPLSFDVVGKFGKRVIQWMEAPTLTATRERSVLDGGAGSGAGTGASDGDGQDEQDGEDDMLKDGEVDDNMEGDSVDYGTL